MKTLTLYELSGLTVLLLLLTLATTQDARAAEPTRIATLLPFVEEALALAPDQATVVASVRRSMRHPIEEELIDLGNPHSPNFERLAEARPELIVADRHLHAAIAPRLSAVGAEVLFVDTTGVTATLDSLDALAQRLGGAPAITQQVAAVRAEINERRVDESLRVLALFGAPGSFYAITNRAWLGQLVEAVGFENLAPATGDERFPGMIVLSDEVLSLLEPDLVVLVAHGDPRKIREDLAQRTATGGAWASLRGAAHGIHVLDPSLFAANPGLGLSEASRVLVRLAAGNGGDATGEAKPAVAAGSPGR